MQEAAAKLVIQKQKWEYNPPMEKHVNFGGRNYIRSGFMKPEQMQELEMARTVLGIERSDTFPCRILENENPYVKQTGKGARRKQNDNLNYFVFCGDQAIKILADAGANFPEKNKFVSPREIS